MNSLDLNIIAAAGLAEAAWAMALMISWCAILMVSCAVAAACYFHSRVFAVTALAIAALFTLVMTPYYGFAPLSPSDYQDPDVVEFAKSFRNMAWGWVISTSASIVVLIWVFAVPSKKRTKPKKFAAGHSKPN